MVQRQVRLAKRRNRSAIDDDPPFSLFVWRSSIPLCDDLWLGMQAQNIAIVDRIVRHFEQEALQHYYAHDSFSMEHLAPLSAMSQMWVFALYEFLRTWLQRASKLIGYSEGLAAQKTTGERSAYMQKITDETKERAKHKRLAPVFYMRHVERVGDAEFITSVKEYRNEVKHLFRDVEAIRLPLAKHEMAGTKSERFMAEAPGYGRVDTFSGSMYWQINLADGYVDVINRHKLADAFMSMKRALVRNTKAMEGFSVVRASGAGRDPDVPTAKKPPTKQRTKRKS
jgi:hypothetical protein